MSPAVGASSAIVLTVEPLRMHTRHPFGISYGTSSTIENLLVRVRYKDYEGLGEAAPAAYHAESIATATSVLSQWAQSDILGCDPLAVELISARLDSSIAGNFAAKCAVEVALHDLAGQISQMSVHKMFGLSGLSAPRTDFTIGIDSLEVVERKTEEALQAGYHILKVKQGTSYDREIIKRIRKIAPDIALRVDANGAWTPKQAVEMSRFLFDHNVEFIEQPLHKFAHLKDWQFVKENSALPVFADESCMRARDVAALAGVVDGVVVKLCKTGGLRQAVKLIHTARAHDLKIMFGCMVESSIGVTAAAHLASLVDYLDLDGALLLADDPYQGALYDDGYLRLPEGAGLGVKPRAH